jgi:short-subunit dehydrogenase
MNIIVTGCSQGIGREIVLLFGKNKENKIIGIARNKSALDEITNILSPQIFKGIPFDLTTIFANNQPLINGIKQHFSEVDIVINNAGALKNELFMNTSIEDIRNMFETNVFAPAEFIRILLPMMGKNTRSHIVNIGSMAGYHGSMKFKGLSWYSASKSALACLTESLSVELKEYNIAVNCLALGSVQTEMLAKAFPGFKAPLLPVEMAEFIANFALNGHKVFNGKILPVALTNP